MALKMPDRQYGINYGPEQILAKNLKAGDVISGDLGRYGQGYVVNNQGGMFENISDQNLGKIREHQAVAQNIDPSRMTPTEIIRAKMMGFKGDNSLDKGANVYRDEQFGKQFNLRPDGTLTMQSVSPRDGAAVTWDRHGDDKHFRDYETGTQNWMDKMRAQGHMFGFGGGSMAQHAQSRLDQGRRQGWEEITWKTGLTPEEFEAATLQLDNYMKEQGLWEQLMAMLYG